MKVAFVFWGLTRSLKYTIDSINKNVFDVMREHGVDYKIFIHTFTQESPISNARSQERNFTIDPEEFKLLNPDYYVIDDQVEIRKQLDLVKYRTHRDYWNSKYQTVDNYICAMYSKQRATKLVEESGIEFDCIVFLRPDVRFLHPIRMEWLTSVSNDHIQIPYFQLWPAENPRMNDRFSITNYENGIRIGNIFDVIYEYSKTKTIHSEQILYEFVVNTLAIRIVYINFFFNRIRADGKEWADTDWKRMRMIRGK